MSDDDFTAAVTLGATAVAFLLAIAAVISTVYVVYVYRKRNEEALFLTRLVHRDIRVGIGCAVLLSYIALSLSGYGFPRPWGAVLFVGALALMMIGPSDDAWLWRKERRQASGGKAKTFPDNGPTLPPGTPYTPEEEAAEMNGG